MEKSIRPIIYLKKFKKQTGWDKDELTLIQARSSKVPFGHGGQNLEAETDSSSSAPRAPHLPMPLPPPCIPSSSGLVSARCSRWARSCRRLWAASTPVRRWSPRRQWRVRRWAGRVSLRGGWNKMVWGETFSRFHEPNTYKQRYTVAQWCKWTTF